MASRLKISAVRKRYQSLLDRVNRIVIKTEEDVLKYKKMRERTQGRMKHEGFRNPGMGS